MGVAGAHGARTRIAIKGLLRLKGRRCMVAGDKVRLAMGMFDDDLRLRRALLEFARLGVEARNVCLIGKRAALEAARITGSECGPRLLPVEAFASPLSLASVVAAPFGLDGAVLQALQHDRDESEWPMPGRYSREPLEERLRCGALLLIARMPNARLQDGAVRVLLRHSQYRVHTEEFLRRR
jgi:hypothetical protein